MGLADVLADWRVTWGLVALIFLLAWLAGLEQAKAIPSGAVGVSGQALSQGQQFMAGLRAWFDENILLIAVAGIAEVGAWSFFGRKLLLINEMLPYELALEAALLDGNPRKRVNYSNLQTMYGGQPISVIPFERDSVRASWILNYLLRQPNLSTKEFPLHLTVVTAGNRGAIGERLLYWGPTSELKMQTKSADLLSAVKKTFAWGQSERLYTEIEEKVREGELPATALTDLMRVEPRTAASIPTK